MQHALQQELHQQGQQQQQQPGGNDSGIRSWNKHMTAAYMTHNRNWTVSTIYTRHAVVSCTALSMPHTCRDSQHNVQLCRQLKISICSWWLGANACPPLA